MNNIKHIILSVLILTSLFFSIGCSVFNKDHASTQNKDSKPRTIVMTDGEIDDHSSMIRFLLYSCDVDLLAIIETNSIFQRHGHSNEDWYEKQLEAYKEVHPNLIKHNANYPTYEKLKSISFIGDENIEHLDGLRSKRSELIPGGKVTYTPEDWLDTPGSDKIIEILLENNPAPVYIQAWGGGNTAAHAFYKLKTEYPNEYDRAISKVTMYNIWYQDGAGNYIENSHPKVTMLYCGSFSGTWNYNSQTDTYDFIEKEIKNNKGPLGSLYPQDYVSEGDSPAFLYLVDNGLRNYEHPTYGGWGGRFEKFDQFDNVYIDAKDDGDKKKPLKRWIDVANNDFQARMNWCVTDYEDANHPPIIKLTTKRLLTVKSGKRVKLDARKSYDPDGNDIEFNWWQYKDIGSYKNQLEIENSDKAEAYFVAPVVNKPETIHVILEVKDNGNPSLVSYERIIVNLEP